MLTINRCFCQCHPLLGQQHPALCLSAQPSELSRSSLYQQRVACFIQLWIPLQSTRQSIMHHIGTGHTADGMLMACQSRDGVGVDLYTGLEFWTFFSLKVRGVDLCADRLIHGNIAVTGSEFSKLSHLWDLIEHQPAELVHVRLSYWQLSKAFSLVFRGARIHTGTSVLKGAWTDLHQIWPRHSQVIGTHQVQKWISGSKLRLVKQ